MTLGKNIIVKYVLVSVKNKVVKKIRKIILKFYDKKKFFSVIELLIIKNSIRNSSIEETPKKLDFSYLTFLVVRHLLLVNLICKFLSYRLLAK